MLIADEQLETLLLSEGVLTPDDIKGAKEVMAREHLTLREAVVRADLLSGEQMGRTIADWAKLPFVKLSDIYIPNEVLELIPLVVAKKQRIIAFKKDGEGLHVAMGDPTDMEMAEFVKKKTGLPVIVYLADENDIVDATSQYTRNISGTFDDIIRQNIGQVRGGNAQEVELPVIKIVDTILSYAYQNKASDVHIEPQEEGSSVRFRIDGILHDIVTLPPEIHPQIIIRIKVMASLRTDEHQAPQDGKLQFKTEEEILDVRVSIVPSTRGEKAVLRLLSERSRQFSLESLGFSAADLAKTKNAYKKPYGMILSTGPTGSGKTTTMYAILKILNQRGINISTIEDPVEYDMEGVTQIQVNPKANLTFANGLKSILRQDPNVILVGEIRDAETASIAVSSAMTGHLVLSTIHANDTATAIPRLFDMGIEPFLVASTVNVVIAQRLVRKIHPVCRVSEDLHAADMEGVVDKETLKALFGKSKSIRAYRGKGCDADHHTGYEGRIGIYEVMVIDDAIRQAILDRKDAATIQRIAIEQGMTTMIEDGLEKVKQGLTTIEEIIRVTKE